MISKYKPYRKFIILSSPRSGTHMMRTALKNHPNIVAGTELFNPDFLKDKDFDAHTPERIILSQNIFRDYPPKVKTVGFIIHRSGTPFGDWPNLWNMLREDKSIYILSLRRRNLLRRYLSYQVMKTFRGAHPQPLHFDPEVLESDFKYQQKEVDLVDQQFANHPLKKVYYEDLCEDYHRTVKSIQIFLGVKPQKLWPDKKGKPKRKLSEAIANYKALKEYFSGTDRAHFFNENEQVTHISKPPIKAHLADHPHLGKTRVGFLSRMVMELKKLICSFWTSGRGRV